MPISTASVPALVVLQQGQVTDKTTGQLTPLALRYFQDLTGALSAIIAAVNAAVGVNSFTLAAQPVLGPADAGFLGFVTDYGHFVRWTGTIWTFAAGDPGNGFFSVRPVAPQEVGWQECDGTATDYLVVGAATLTATAFTTPDLKTTHPGYLKTGAAYTGVPVAATAPGAVSTASTVKVDGGLVIAPDTLPTAGSGATGALAAEHGHSHAITDSTGHTHAITTTPDATGEPTHLVLRCYFRR